MKKNKNRLSFWWMFIIMISVGCCSFLLLLLLLHQNLDIFESFSSSPTSSPRVVFMTFGGGGSNYHEAVRRLCNQAQALELFDDNVGYADTDLIQDPSFWSMHGKFVEANRRGYGYWIWKPYLIMKQMKLQKDGDAVMYLDCGCELGLTKKENLQKSIEDVLQQKLIATSTGYLEKQWTKMDLFKYFDQVENSEVLDTFQLQAGAILILNTPETRKFVQGWYDTCCIENYRFVDDSPSLIANDSIFTENRHDQSVFSVLAKVMDLYQVEYSLVDAIYYSRNKSGVSAIE